MRLNRNNVHDHTIAHVHTPTQADQMSRPLFILLLTAATYVSCGISTNNNADQVPLGSDPIERDTTTESSSGETNGVFEGARKFVERVLNENMRTHSYPPSSERLEHFNLFSKDGLQEILAFSNMEYPQSAEPSHYEHFTLFCYRYSDAEKAENSFHQLAELIQIDLSSSDSINPATKRLAERVIAQSKPGGLIVQKDTWIFSLVETCRNTPIGGTWMEYENLFIDYLLETSGNSIRALNADCGKMKYELELRK